MTNKQDVSPRLFYGDDDESLECLIRSLWRIAHGQQLVEKFFRARTYGKNFALDLASDLNKAIQDEGFILVRKTRLYTKQEKIKWLRSMIDEKQIRFPSDLERNADADEVLDGDA